MPAAVATGGSTPAIKNQGKSGPLKPIGQFMDCGECGKQFTVVSGLALRSETPLTCQTAYTKEHPSSPSTYLCVPCCYALGINPFEKPKKAGKRTGTKDDRAKIVHYEERKGVEGLSDLCIQVSQALLYCKCSDTRSSSEITSRKLNDWATSARLTWTKFVVSSPRAENCQSPNPSLCG